MEYSISRNNIPSQLIQVELTLACRRGETVQLQIPSWRPGRYELANYAQRIKSVRAFAGNEEQNIQKMTKDLWQFQAGKSGNHQIQYEYHASHMDAGGSWSDDEQLYLNFINFIFQVKGRENEALQIRLDLPSHYKIATALPLTERFLLHAKGFEHLVDSPLIASATLKHDHYKVGETTFHLWFQGEIRFDLPKLREQFIRFTQKQMEAFEDFPASDFHFLFQLLPYKHYHGVEHRFSTVITLGPSRDFSSQNSLDQLIGISSHELYHFWNVCRIRPKELLPYDFSREAYFDSGIVAEGVTTYMGDLFLLKSGCLSISGYLTKVERLINRESESFGWKNQSIAESSFDLWLDGYKPGIPGRTVSIYTRGALISLCLDLILIKNGSSLSEVMKRMWVRFGKKEMGYTLQDFRILLTQASNNRTAISEIFRQYIYGKEDLLPLLADQLAGVGIALEERERNDLESWYGLMTDRDGTITGIHPDGAAYEHLMIGDVVAHQELLHSKILKLNISRQSRRVEFSLVKSDSILYKNYILVQSGPTELISQWTG